MERLTARSPQNGLAYLVKVKSDEQEVDSAYPNTLRCILEAFNRLAEYEDRDEGLRNEYARLTNQSCFDEPETYTTGYRNGHANGRAELIAWLLGIADGVESDSSAR